jgi:hypothetical protein
MRAGKKADRITKQGIARAVAVMHCSTRGIRGPF